MYCTYLSPNDSLSLITNATSCVEKRTRLSYIFRRSTWVKSICVVKKIKAGKMNRKKRFEVQNGEVLQTRFLLKD